MGKAKSKEEEEDGWRVGGWDRRRRRAEANAGFLCGV